MKHHNLFTLTLLILASGFMTGCNPDEVDAVQFDVTTADEVKTIKVGEEVTFLFKGNADYITFFSGESGNSYANINRTTAELRSLFIESTIKQQYTDKEYYNKPLLHIYLSEDFKGDYSVEGIKQGHWTEISGNGSDQLAVPVPPTSSPVTVDGSYNLITYSKKSFYVAFLYDAPKRENVPTADGGGKYVQAPRIDVLSWVLHKESVQGETIDMSNTALDWGFQIVYENSEKKGTYSVNDESLLFQPQKNKEHNDQDIKVWMVSQKLTPSSVSPDKGIAIKGTDAALASYTYKYTSPGEYKATFIATNANLWNSRQMIKEITLKVIP